MSNSTIQKLFYPSAVTNYFKEAAEQLFNHTEDAPSFARNYTEFTEMVIRKMPLENIVLIIDQRAGTIADNLNGAFYDNKRISFFLLKKVENDDFDNEEQAYQLAYEALEKLLKLFYQERKVFKCNTMMQYLDSTNIAYEEVGPEYENTFGLFVSVAFRVPANHLLYD